MLEAGLLLERLLWGTAIGCLCFLLRSNIDRRKDVLVELFTFALPMLLAALYFRIQGFAEEYEADWQHFATSLAVVLQFTCLALPIFVVTHLVERLLRGDALQLPDLFRITTIVGLATFAIVDFFDLLEFEFVAAVLVTYFLGEWASTHKKPKLAWTIVILGTVSLWLLSPSTTLGFNVRLLNLRLLSAEGPTGIGFGEAGISRLSLAAGVLFAPAWLAKLMHQSSMLHSMGWRIASWRFSVADPREQIFCRPALALWCFRPGTCYLNHGSFGAVPLVVRDAQHQLKTAMEEQPMDFLSRNVEAQWLASRSTLASWLGTESDNIAFCENATAAMNELASWFPLRADDEVVLNDHEYGAVLRIWKRKCASAGAKLRIAELPIDPCGPSRQAIVDTILGSCTNATRLVICSHITSPTAIRLPVEELCRQLRDRGIPTCIDGPHALLQEDVQVNDLGCDFYTASCHKWLCAPLGSGFLYVAPEWHSSVRPSHLSWGRLPPTERERWSDELLWTGTRDYSPYLCVPDAIRFFQAFDRERLDIRNHHLASYARRKLLELPGTKPVTPDDRDWYGWMVGVWLPDAPPGSYQNLQQQLFENHGIEVPIVAFGSRQLIRVSCHLHTTTEEIDFLCRALSKELPPLNRSRVTNFH